MKKISKVLLTAVLLLFFANEVCAGDLKPVKSKKKIVFVKDDDGEFFKAVADLMSNLLEQKGWTKENSEYIVLSLQGKEQKADEIAEKLRGINPDVVLINTTLIKNIALKVTKDRIPFVAGGGLEFEDESGKMLLVDNNGFPVKNVTGTYTMPRKQLINSFRFLNKIAPIKKKKVVFATYTSAAFTEKKIRTALKELNIELKDFKTFTYFDDYQEFVKKYNEDKEVGWIISGEMISRKKDGTACSFEEFFKWDRENVKKPNIAFWENSVVEGKLCALAIDSMTTVNQMITMADRMLNGEKLNRVKPEDPAKTLVILNQKRAKELGVKFPVDIIRSAWKIYTDYEGHFEVKK